MCSCGILNIYLIQSKNEHKPELFFFAYTAGPAHFEWSIFSITPIFFFKFNSSLTCSNATNGILLFGLNIGVDFFHLKFCFDFETPTQLI